MLLTNNFGYCTLSPEAPHTDVRRHAETHSYTEDFSAWQEKQKLHNFVLMRENVFLVVEE